MGVGTLSRYAITLGLVFSVGCLSLSRHRLRADGRDEMLELITTRIPRGTSLADAKSLMEKAGFECQFLTSGWFSEYPGFIGADPDQYRSIDNARFLSCKRTESSGILTANIWSVAIVVDDSNQVTDVLVLLRYEGP